jgi:hypothetical protein
MVMASEPRTFAEVDRCGYRYWNWSTTFRVSSCFLLVPIGTTVMPRSDTVVPAQQQSVHPRRRLQSPKKIEKRSPPPKKAGALNAGEDLLPGGNLRATIPAVYIARLKHVDGRVVEVGTGTSREHT